MNREQALNFGVKQELYKEFQEQYNRDLNKRARDISERREGGKTALAVEYLRDAIGAMVRLIPDPVRLSSILSNVNRHYQFYQNERNEIKDNAQKPTVTVQKGASECP